MHLSELPTPALLLDLDVLDRNIAWMAQRAVDLGVTIRPHVKTHKCMEVAERQRDVGGRGITVATLQEAHDFATHGFSDVTWAFPIPIGQIGQAAKTAERCTLRLVVDSTAAVEALIESGESWHVWLKVDCGYHRVGVDPGSPESLALVERIVGAPALTFDGILTHAGHTYDGPTPVESRAVAHMERDVMVAFADRLRQAGIEVPAISVGSTPGMRAVESLDGVTEARPGNYVFFDHTMVSLGACRPEECAVTVLATVISSRADLAQCVVDAGALALSKDTGRRTSSRPTMGEIYDDYRAGTLRADKWVTALSQEHGKVHGALPVGTHVRILPNHSCLTAACFDEYHVLRGDEVVDRWKIWRRR